MRVLGALWYKDKSELGCVRVLLGFGLREALRLDGWRDGWMDGCI